MPIINPSPGVSQVVARAYHVLRSAHGEIQKLITESVAAQNYDDVTLLASIARSLVDSTGAALVDEPITQEVQPVIAEVTSPAVHDNPSTFTKATSPSSGFPRFERESTRLVKIGWSKKDKATYEHKAPFIAVTAVSNAIAAKNGKFEMDHVLPVKDAEGSDVPSYQAYLVLAWLRHEGVVERNGNDGYTANRAMLHNDVITQKLNLLPSR